MFNQALAANPIVIEMAEEVSARGRAIEQLQAEVARLQAEAADFRAQYDRMVSVHDAAVLELQEIKAAETAHDCSRDHPENDVYHAPTLEHPTVASIEKMHAFAAGRIANGHDEDAS